MNVVIPASVVATTAFICFLESTIYNVETKCCKCTANPYTLCKFCVLYTYNSYHLYLCTFTHVYVLFPVWCSVVVRTDCQSNALTPFICSMVTSLMDVMTYMVVHLSCYLLCGHLYSSVKCVVCKHTVHRSLSGLVYTYLL